MYILWLQSMISFLVKLNSYKPIVKHSTIQSYGQCFNHAVSPKGADIKSQSRAVCIKYQLPQREVGVKSLNTVGSLQTETPSWPRPSRSWRHGLTMQGPPGHCGSQAQLFRCEASGVVHAVRPGARQGPCSECASVPHSLKEKVMMHLTQNAYLTAWKCGL